MDKLKFNFDYWEQLKKYMLETYSKDIVFLYDSEVSYFDAEDVPLIKPRLYKFDSIEEFISWHEDSWKENGEKINILTDLSVLWINGVIDEKIIYELRG